MLLTGDAPAVSIAIRAYRRRWLGEAIASVLAQTYRDLELVVYDDAGDLEPVVEEFAADARVRYVRAERPLDASGRFSAAVALCRGRYIGMLDDDDFYEPEFVERLAAALDDDPGAGVAFCRNVWDVDGELHVVDDGRAAGRQADSVRSIFRPGWSVPPSRMLMRREALEDAERLQPMPDGVAPDWFVHARTALAGWHHVFVDEALAVCRWHGDQLTRSGAQAYDTAVASREQIRTDDPAVERLRAGFHASVLIDRGLFKLRSGDRHGARADLRAAALADSRESKGVRRLGGAVAAVPGAGPVAARAHRFKRRFHQRDALPPGVVARSSRPGRQVARDALPLAVGSGAAQVVTVLVAPLLTRLFDPSEVGAAGVLTAAMAFVALIACLRFDIAIPLARGARATAELCGLCILAGAVVTLLVAAAAALFGQALCDAANVPQIGAYVWLVPVHAAVVAVGLVGTGLLIRRRRYTSLGGVRFAQVLGQSATQLGAGTAGAGAAWFAGGVTAGAAAYSVSAVAATRSGVARRQIADALRGAGAAARRWGRFAAWSFGAATLQGAAFTVPPVLVAALYGPAEAGLFILTQRVLGLPVAFAGEAVGAAWFGTAAEIVREDRGPLRAPLAVVTRTLLIAGGAVLVLVMLAGPPLFGPVFGDEWDAGGELVLALAPLHLSLFAAVPAGLALQATGRTDVLTAVAAGRLAAPIAGIAGGHALGWSLTASLGLYAGAMAAVSALVAVAAWRLSDVR